jgi:DnaJ-domain-containing protein 1
LGDIGAADRNAYATMDDGLKLNNSLLTVEVNKKTPLYKDLARLVKINGAEIAFRPCEDLIEKGLWILRTNIGKDLDSLAKSSSKKTPAEEVKDLLPVIARSTLLKIEIPKAFPMLTDQLDASVDAYLAGIHDRGLIEEGKDAFMKPMSMVMVIFVTKLVLMAFRPTRPLSRAVTALELGMSEEMAGYFAAALPLIAADCGMDFYEYRVAANDEATTRQWFNTSAGATSFYEYFAVSDSAARTEATWGKFKSSFLQNALFLGVPILAQLAKPEILRALDGFRLKKFKNLGFEDFTWDKDAIRKHAEAKEQEIRSSDLFKQDPYAGSLKIIDVRNDADSLIKFIVKQEKTAQNMIKDFAREFQQLGIPKGKETLNLQKLRDALSIMEARYQSYQIGKEELENAQNAFKEITGAVNSLLDGTKSPIRDYILRRFGDGPQRGPHEMFRERLFAEVYGFTNFGARDFAFGAAEKYEDWYAVLGVPRESSDAAIKSKYRQLQLKYHPDRNPGDAAAEEMAKTVNRAYDVLGDAEKKARFDAIYDGIHGIAMGGKP